MRCFMVGGSGTTTVEGGHVFMSRHRCLFESIKIPTNQTITFLASDSDPSLIFRVFFKNIIFQNHFLK